MRFENRAQAGGRDAKILNIAIDGRQARAHFGQVRAYIHADRAGLTGGRVVEKQFAEAVIDDAPWSGARRSNIRAVILNHFSYRLRRRIETKQGYWSVA